MCIDLRGIRETLLSVSGSLVRLEGAADPATFIRRAQPKEDVLQNLNNQLNSVSLKEHVLTIFAFEREMAERERAFVGLRFELSERALQLDHVEMLRRLDLLNHAHEDARQKEASFVGREVYESQVKDSNKWRDEVNSALSNRQGKASVTSGLAGAFGGLALSALFAMIMYLAKAVLSGFPK
jgi:hypothetical protein